MLKYLLILGVSLPLSCKTVPEDAPEEFHEAYSAVESMKDSESDKMFPKTSERIEERFTNSLTLLDQAEENDSDDIMDSAKAEASMVSDDAMNVKRLQREVMIWDENEVQFEQAVASLDMEREDRLIGVRTISPLSPFAKLKGVEIISTLAYFNTGDRENPLVNTHEIENFKKIVGNVDNYQIVLTGFADGRGDAALNSKLALLRAKHLARMLQSQGFEAKKILIETAGESVSDIDHSNLASMQLERRVQAKLTILDED